MKTLGRNVLISSAGRRVSLLRSFERALSALDLQAQVYACDVSTLSAAFHAAAGRFLVPRCTDPAFLPAVIDGCRLHDIGIIVPTIDTELPIYAAARDELLAAGVAVLISDSETVAIGGDKVLTHDWLVDSGFPTVKQVSLDEASSASLTWPVIAKPKNGSASVGVRRCSAPDQLSQLDASLNYIVQETAPGDEHTVDVLVLKSGQVISAVPRRRIEVRAGEVSKGETRHHPGLERLARQIVEKLPKAYGALNVQIFLDERTGAMNVIEINPRFGGGFPLAHNAGADFPRWLIEDAFGLPSTASSDWESGVTMLRYDDAIFFRSRPRE